MTPPRTGRVWACPWAPSSTSSACIPASATVVRIDVGTKESRSERLFFRRFRGSRYSEVPLPPGATGFARPITSPTESVIFSVALVWETRGWDHLGIYRVTLPGGVAECVLPATESRSWFISSLLGVGARPGTLCVVRADQVVAEDGRSAVNWRYSVQQLDLVDKTFELQTELLLIFA